MSAVSTGPRAATPEATARFRVTLVLIALTAWFCVSCATNSPAKSEQLADGSHRLQCRTSLPACLERAEVICQGNRYTVLRAVDHHDYMGGVGTVENEVRTSEALFRCGYRARSLSEPDPMAVPPPTAGTTANPSSVTPSGAPSTAPMTGAGRACVPGATQPCTGRAACRGGQACLRDGSGFSACDCGDAAPSGAIGEGQAGSGGTPPDAGAPPAPLGGSPATIRSK